MQVKQTKKGISRGFLQCQKVIESFRVKTFVKESQ